MKVKPWQMAVIVIGLVVGVGSVIWQFMGDDGPDLSYRLTLVDVETGDIFEISDYRRITAVLPAARPGSDARALVPIEKDKAGDWYLTENGQRMLGAVTVKTDALDPDSGKVVRIGQNKDFPTK